MNSHNQPAASRVSRGKLFGTILGSSFLAAGICFGAWQIPYPRFEVPAEFHIQGLGAADAAWASFLHHQQIAEFRNATVSLSIVGLVVGVCLALFVPTGGSRLARLFFGIVTGPVAGVAAAWVGCELSRRITGGELQRTVVESSQLQAALLAVLAGVISLGPWASGGWTKIGAQAVGAAAILGAIAGLLFPLACGVLVPAENVSGLLPQSFASQSLWLILASLSPGLALALEPRRSAFPGTSGSSGVSQA